MTKRNVYILLTDTGSILTKLIKLYTKKPYNHASISFDSKLTEVYSFGRKHERNPFRGGFVKENVKSGLFRQADCAIYSLTVSENEMKKMKQYVCKMKAEKELYKYNFSGLFGFLFNKPIEREKAMFCSQFVASVLEKGTVTEFEKPISLIAPGDLQNVAKLTLVYEGKLRDYLDGREEKVYVPVQTAMA